MLRLAIAGHEAFVISELEIARGGVTYTVDTLTALREQQPLDELFFLIGGGQPGRLADLGGIPGVARHATIVVVNRPGYVAQNGPLAVGPDLGPEARPFRHVMVPGIGIS